MEQFDNLLNNQLNLNIHPSEIKAFEQYFKLLKEWNQKINLTAITEPEEVFIKHFFDSLSCLKILPSKGFFSLIDIGTGAGFPGIPLKILRPEMKLTLVESVQKKALFCKNVAHELALRDVLILNQRAEDVGQDPMHRETYDWAVARAVAALPTLLEYLLPLVKVGGKALAMKGTHVTSEIKQSEKALNILGGEIIQPVQFVLPKNYGKRTLIQITKKHSTPVTYPRRPGVPAKKPLL